MTVALSFLAPLLGIAQPFSIITILYINLVMDALAAIAYGCEPALERYMADKPIKRSESIITKYMASQIATVSVYSTVIGLLILLCEPFQRLFYPVTVNSAVPVNYAEGALLAFFMMTVIFNGFNARSTSYNVLEHIQENKAFVIVMCAVLGLLVFLIQVLNKVAGVQAIDLRTWISMFAFAILIIPIDLIRKTLLN